MRRTRVAPTVATIALCCSIAAGCTPGSDSGSDETQRELQAELTVVAPAVRSSKFCEAIILLNADLSAAGPNADIGVLILDGYLAIEPVVPDEIRDDFRAIIAQLQLAERIAGGENVPITADSTTSTIAPTTTTTLTIPTTLAQSNGQSETAPSDVADTLLEIVTDPTILEGARRGPSVEPAEIVAEYVDFNCRGNSNNPGPAPTQPDSGTDDQ